MTYCSVRRIDGCAQPQLDAALIVSGKPTLHAPSDSDALRLWRTERNIFARIAACQKGNEFSDMDLRFFPICTGGRQPCPSGDSWERSRSRPHAHQLHSRRAVVQDRVPHWSRRSLLLRVVPMRLTFMPRALRSRANWRLQHPIYHKTLRSVSHALTPARHSKTAELKATVPSSPSLDGFPMTPLPAFRDLLAPGRQLSANVPF